MTNLPSPPLGPSEETTSPGKNRLTTGLLMAGSAFLGGLAVVFWHRKSLAKLRQPELAAIQPPASQDVESE